MRRTPITIAVLGVLLLALAGSAAAIAPRAQLRELVCQRALDPPARAIDITAVMRPLAGTQRMAMRVSLLSRTGGAYRPVVAPSGSKLGTWITPPDPSLGQRPGDRWKVAFPVADLPAPASYRYRAAFRWIGLKGVVLGTAVRTSAGCRQPELRPDLQARSLSVQPIAGHPKLDQYVALIRNAGATPARSFEVAFRDVSQARTVTIALLRAHAATRLSFTGPACVAGDPPTVTLDPQNRVDDLNRANNVATAHCG